MEKSTLTPSELDELRHIAAQMYRIVEDVEDIGTCANPSDEDLDCPQDCRGCRWYTCELRDRLARLGVDI